MNDLTCADEFGTVTLFLDDGELECEIITVFETDGNHYAALRPLADDGTPCGDDIYLYRYVEKDGDYEIENIESDQEMDAASAVYDEWEDEQMLLSFDE